MKRLLRSVVVLAMLFTIASTLPGRSAPRRHSDLRDTAAAQRRHASTYCSSCERDTNGRIKRRTSVRRQFQREHPCPLTGLQTGPCPGYIKDHIRALKHGGTDTVDNMQWEKADEAKAKNRIE